MLDFRTEAAIMSEMKHPNILTFLGMHYNQELSLTLTLTLLTLTLTLTLLRCGNESSWVGYSNRIYGSRQSRSTPQGQNGMPTPLSLAHHTHLNAHTACT